MRTKKVAGQQHITKHISCVASLLGLWHIVAKSHHKVSYAEMLWARL